MLNSPQEKESAAKSAKKWGLWKIFLLVVAVGVLLFAAYFVTLTFQIGQQLASGSYDLSSFAVDGQSTIEGGEGVTGFTDPYVNNYVNDPAIGPEDAPITIVAFEDFECPYCAAAFPNIKTMLSKHGDKVRFIYRDFPISSIHPSAQDAAEAANCADEQGQFWPYHDRLYQNQDYLHTEDLKRYAEELNLDTEVFDNCLDSDKYAEEVLADFQDGVAAGVTGTPTFFINGNVVPGVISEQGFDQIVEHFAG